jgi:hypothetical protein
MRQAALPKRLGFPLAVFFLAVAVFNAWRDQKQRVDSDSAEIASLQLRISDLTEPNFAAQIDFAILGAQQAGSHAGLIVTLANAGAASAVLPGSWKLQAITGDGRAFDGWPNSLKDKNLDFCISPTSLRRFVRSDALYLKASTPVERNGFEQGFLWFGFPTLSRQDLIAPATRLVIGGESVTGQKFKGEITVEELAKRSSEITRFFAGIANPSPISAPCVDNLPY